MSDHKKREVVELIQVLAVGAASLEVEKFGGTEFEKWVLADDGGPAIQGYEVLDKVAFERIRQDKMWGNQGHDRTSWAMILAEEIGEWAAEVKARDEQGLTEGEYELATDVLGTLIAAGEGARYWLENHEWPERQQQVFDEEKAEKA